MAAKKKSAASGARSTAKKIAHKAEQIAEDIAGGGDVVPGAPAAKPPTVEEPTEPTGPLPTKHDQSGPTTHSPTGERSSDGGDTNRQQGEFLTTAQGARVTDTDHSLKACLLYTSPSPRDPHECRMPSSA